MIPRASYATPLARYMRRRSLLLHFEGLTAIAAVIALATGGAVIARSVIIALLNHNFPGTPPGCC
ncbi:hypothetical protein M3484_01825 [Pseudomonas sp. GX19020]|uniref:hypothetical protein n=1 Tax=Pseudomonas sp. GX19020 TaxID=2942277 RepID=UPI0020193773|nr:hypothetical protein [Pseudomonas sp. GX19020]MCL4065314.1 hypothetical protein [Pseudomonas sp. GX19020]